MRSAAELICIVVLQELLRPSSFAESPMPTEAELLNIRALASEDAGLVWEYAYALKLAFAEKFSVETHDAKLKEALPHGKDSAQQTACATPGLSNV